MNRKTRLHSGNHEVFFVIIRLHFITKKSSEKTCYIVLKLKGAATKYQIQCAKRLSKAVQNDTVVAQKI